MIDIDQAKLFQTIGLAVADATNCIAELEAEVARFTECLRIANANAEHFEREWYLSGDKIEAAEAKLRVINELKPLNKWDVEDALAEDGSLLFLSHDELRVRLDELEALLK